MAGGDDVMAGSAQPPATQSSALSADASLLDPMGQGVCVTGPTLDEPGPVIDYVNDAYLDVFGCERADVIGRSPRFAQGPLTDRATLDRIREHLGAERTIRAQAINYRFNRTAFRLRWRIDPIRRDDTLTGFIAVMDDVTVEDRVRRRLSALDTLLVSGRRAVESPRSDRVAAIARTLCEAAEHVLDDIGDVHVETADELWRGGGRLVAADRAPGESFVIGDRIRLTASVHPDAVDLLDRVAIEELRTHAGWLLELAPWA